MASTGPNELQSTQNSSNGVARMNYNVLKMLSACLVSLSPVIWCCNQHQKFAKKVSNSMFSVRRYPGTYMNYLALIGAVSGLYFRDDPTCHTSACCLHPPVKQASSNMTRIPQRKHAEIARASCTHFIYNYSATGHVS
jgi:hypothetical protein